MDKETLSNYGWVVIVVLILAVMLALATPFGNFVANGVKATTLGFTETISKALGIDIPNIEGMDIGGISASNPNKEPENFNHEGNIPNGGIYIDIDTGRLPEGSPLPTKPKLGDEYIYGDYIYKYSYYARGNDSWYLMGGDSSQFTFWGCRTYNKDETIYGSPLNSICGYYVKYMHSAYQGCTKIEGLSTEYKMPEKCLSTANMFFKCETLKSIPENFKIPDSVTLATKMFYKCTALESIPKGFHLPDNATSMTGVFMDCTSLKYIADDFIINSEGSDITDFFNGCTSLETIPDNFKFPNRVAKMDSFFEGCTSLKTLPSNFKLPSTISLNGSFDKLFKDCKSLNLPEGFFDTALEFVNEEYGFTTTRMFENCTSLTNIPMSKFYKNGCMHTSMYSGCTNLTGTITIEDDSGYEGMLDGTTKPITVRYSYDYQKSEIENTCENTNLIFELIL